MPDNRKSQLLEESARLFDSKGYENTSMRDTSASAVLADWSTFRSEELRAALVKERDRYETVLSRLTDAVELPTGVKRHYFQLAILGAFNWALTWYRPGRDSPATVAKQLLAVFRPTADGLSLVR